MKVSFDEAFKIILSSAERLSRNAKTEKKNIEEALYYVSFSDVKSEIDIPPFSRAMVDGYAIVASDSFGANTYSPASLKIIAKIDAGETKKVQIKKGEAAKISTGAKVPDNADAVVKVEDAKEKHSAVEIYKAITPGKNISYRGEDVKKGDVIVKKWQKIEAQDVAVLAACGIRKVEVLKKITASIISTGSELMEPEKELEEGKIYDVNSFSLFSSIKMLNCDAERIGIIEDEREKVEKAIKNARGELILISGATSAGEKDFVPEIVEKLGKLHFRGVNMRPGAPVSFGEIGDKAVFLLPGFPVAALAAFELLVIPFIQKLQHQEAKPIRKKALALLGENLASEAGKLEFVRAKLESKKGKLTAYPISSKGAGIITTLSKADAYFLVREEIEGLKKGEKLEVFLLRE